jgi:hypothetical protein
MSARTSSSPRKTDSHATERRRQVRGLLLLAFLAILFAILRAGLGHAFNAGWWRLW